MVILRESNVKIQNYFLIFVAEKSNRYHLLRALFLYLRTKKAVLA